VLDKTPVDFCAIAREAVEQVGPLLESRSHRLELALPARPCLITGDRTRLVQVVANLVGNAARYTPEGGHIAVCLETDASALILTVTDNGIGLSNELLPYLFDLYVQAERSSSREKGGLGLGLALVKSLVEAHGGEVSAASGGENMGSVFTVRLRH
jgi:signal transduction histidine kinase